MPSKRIQSGDCIICMKSHCVVCRCHGNELCLFKRRSQQKSIKMSIFVKNVDWSQTESEVIINVPINRRKSIDDVVIAEKFLKVNVHPYFYELFFEHPISVDQSTCKILESHFRFRLKKANQEWWQSLGKTAKPARNSNDDIISIEQKKEIFSEYEKSVKEEIAKQRKERASLKHSEIDKQIERASRIREKIDETEISLKHCQIVSKLLSTTS